MLAKPGAKGAPTRSKAVNHFWYGDRSPWTERRLELSFDELQSQPPAKAVIMDRENPPQPRSARAVDAAAVRASLHQQILLARSGTGKFASGICRCAGPPGL